MYFTTGSNDVVLVVADGSDAVAVGMAVRASGSISKIETVRAWMSSEFKGSAGKGCQICRCLHPARKMIEAMQGTSSLSGTFKR